jgi:hypothetical protein
MLTTRSQLKLKTGTRKESGLSTPGHEPDDYPYYKKNDQHAHPDSCFENAADYSTTTQKKTEEQQ